MDDRLRDLQRVAESPDGTDEDRLRYFLGLSRWGLQVPILILKKEVEGESFADRVNITIQAVSKPRARVPIELVILMNLGNKRRPLESFHEWKGRFTFRFREDSDEGPAKLKLASMSPGGPRIEGCKVFNVWTDDLIYLTWFKAEDGLPNDVPWLIDVHPIFDPARMKGVRG